MTMNAGLLRSSVIVVIEAYLQHGMLSRSDLAALTGISRSAITEITQNLLDMGLLQEFPVIQEKQGRGRPAISLRFRASHGYFIGVSVTDTPSLVILADMQGNVVGECEIPPNDVPKNVGVIIRRAMNDLLRRTRVPRDRLLSIGIAVTGVVDETDGTCRYSAALNWRDVPIAKLVQEATGVNAYVGNDANAVAIGEKLFGRARDLRHFSSLILGRNIGCAHYIEGDLYRGYDGGAGEIGHVTLDINGPRCRCGKNGCLDMFAGGTAMLDLAKAAGLDCQTVRDLEELATVGNAKAMGILRNGAQALGLAVASLIQINNPECVLFADVEGFGKGIFQATTRQVIENNILPRFLASTEIVFHQVERSFLARAAASIAAQQYLRTGIVSRVNGNALPNR
ncbi:MAG TPA: ROK family transcriptional regulator [Granulicella sp.]|jgi:predicted NBD/HSP70 family sugar kinase